jgi:hypothetical protein
MLLGHAGKSPQTGTLGGIKGNFQELLSLGMLTEWFRHSGKMKYDHLSHRHPAAFPPMWMLRREEPKAAPTKPSRSIRLTQADLAPDHCLKLPGRALTNLNGVAAVVAGSFAEVD